MAAAGCRTRRAARARSRAVSSWAAPLQGEWRSSDYSETGFLLQEKICFVAPRAATHLPLLVPEWRFPESLPRFPDLPARLPPPCRQASTRNARLRARTQRGKAAQLHTAVTGPVSHG